MRHRNGSSGPAAWLIRILLVLLETVGILLLISLGALYMVVKGPSPAARDLFVMSVRETSAVGFLADIFLTPEEIAAIEAPPEENTSSTTDLSMITLQPKPEATETEGPKADAWGLVDEDGDGIILESVKGLGFSGYMMVVLDPSRVVMGSVPEHYGVKGYSVAEMVEKYDAVAGINAGGFEDPNGSGNGSIPNSMTVVDGVVYGGGKGCRDGFAGFDENHILHVGKLTPEAAEAEGIVSGASFGPVLVNNGVACELPKSGVNPRTAIGQRSDGAVLLLVIDGRQVISLGATYQDMIALFLEYGAVNACNMDGGSSSLMWFDGDYINNSASIIGIRPVPTTFLVLKEGSAS